MPSLKTLLFYSASCVCSCAVNFLCGLLLVAASPHTRQVITPEIGLENGISLGLSDAEKIDAPPILAQPILTITTTAASPSIEPISSTYTPLPEIAHSLTSSSELSSTSTGVSLLNETPHNLQAELFFQQAYDILSSFEQTAPRTTTQKKPSIDAITADHQTYSYHQKVMNHLTASRKILFPSCISQLRASQNFPEKNPSLLLCIKKDGSLGKLELVESSGSRIYDNFCLKVIKHASPLPKIPDHLGVENFVFTGPLGL